MESAHTVMIAHSSTLMMRRETWSTHFQIFQKEWHFLLCLKRPEQITREDTTTTTTTRVTSTTQATITKNLLHPSAHLHSVPWTPNQLHLWSKSQALLRLLPSVDSTQTSTFNQLLQWMSNNRSIRSSSVDNHQLRYLYLRIPRCKLSKCSTSKLTTTTEMFQPHRATKTKASTRPRVTETRTTSSKNPQTQRRTPSTDTKRKKAKVLIKRPRRVRKLKDNRRSMWPSKHQRLSNQPKMKNQSRLRSQSPNLLITPLPNEQLVPKLKSEYEIDSPYLSPISICLCHYWVVIANEDEWYKLMTLKWIHWSLFTLPELYLRKRDTTTNI